MPSVGIEQQESITGHPAVMVARGFSGAAFGKVTFIPAGIGALVFGKFFSLVSKDAMRVSGK